MELPKRAQASLTAVPERRLLNGMCRHAPRFIRPDHLTAIGLIGSCLVFVGYAGSWGGRGWLWLAVLGLVVNWIGDSLDGSLARYRGVTRPLYGYFLDHSVDALGYCILMLALGCSPYVRLDVALFALVGLLMMSIYVFIRSQVTGILQLSFTSFGPTEFRILLIILSLFTIFHGTGEVTIGSFACSEYDVVLMAIGILSFGLFLISVVQGLFTLRDIDAAESALPSELHPRGTYQQQRPCRAATPLNSPNTRRASGTLDRARRG